MDNNRNYNHMAGKFDNRRSFFNGQCFSCHNVGHKAAQCVAYKTIMTREAQKQRSITRIVKITYNNFSALENEINALFLTTSAMKILNAGASFGKQLRRIKPQMSKHVE